MFCCSFWTRQVYYGKSETSLLWDNLYRLCTNYYYTMVVKIDQSDCAIGNLLDNPIDKISNQTCFYVSHVVFTYRANIVATSFTHLHVIHVSHYLHILV